MPSKRAQATDIDDDDDAVAVAVAKCSFVTPFVGFFCIL